MTSLRLLVAAAVIAPSLVAGAPSACAGEGPRAALVVDTGSEVQRFCVSLPEQTVSGIELIVLANQQHGLAYHLGYGGEAVCMLAGVGPTGDDCFEQYPDYWGYWRGTGAGWSWSGSGAARTQVSDGDVEGWAWGAGSDGSSHPAPPATAFGSVCREVAAAAPSPEPEPDASRDKESGRRPQSAQPVAAATPSPAVSDDLEGDDRSSRRAGRERASREDKPRGSEPRLTPAPTPQVSPLAAEETGSTGPPAAGLFALLGAGALAAGSAVLIRRRRT